MSNAGARSLHHSEMIELKARQSILGLASSSQTTATRCLPVEYYIGV
jgi:hypothetical protein